MNNISKSDLEGLFGKFLQPYSDKAVFYFFVDLKHLETNNEKLKEAAKEYAGFCIGLSIEPEDQDNGLKYLLLDCDFEYLDTYQKPLNTATTFIGGIPPQFQKAFAQLAEKNNIEADVHTPVRVKTNFFKDNNDDTFSLAYDENMMAVMNQTNFALGLVDDIIKEIEAYEAAKNQE